MAQTSAARKEAFTILLAMEHGGAHSDDLLRGSRVSRLSASDRNLTTALVLGVLRWQIALDVAIRRLLDRPNAKLDGAVLITLRLGAFQLLHMNRIPARAAIDESVELTKQAGHRFAAGMVNAVLRKLASGAEEAGSAKEVSAYPAWMVDRWTGFWGEERTCEICRHGQQQPALAVRIASALVDEEFSQAAVKFAPGELVSAARRVANGDITATRSFREGRVRVQDEGSQLVAEIAGKGSAILDCCAAPGGKTLILAERNPDARIVACEVSARRLEVLRKRLAEVGGGVECLGADATSLPYEDEFDLVLADVPCSGTGTLGRNPEIRHKLSAEELTRQAEQQRAILDSALRAVRPDGRVVYSTCSLEPEENEQVVAAVLGVRGDTRVLSMYARLDNMEREGLIVSGASEKLKERVTPEGYLRLFPGSFDTDGFFVALLQKGDGRIT